MFISLCTIFCQKNSLSTEDHLLSLTSTVSGVLDGGKASLCMFFVMFKAFDTVRHGLLLQMLQNIVIRVVIQKSPVGVVGWCVRPWEADCIRDSLGHGSGPNTFQYTYQELAANFKIQTIFHLVVINLRLLHLLSS